MNDVLVVGAGPTGLTLAAQLHARGAKVRLVERRQGRQESRAFIVHPRTLEVLEPLGLAERLVARGDPGAEVRLHHGRRVARVHLAGPDSGDCAFPFLLAIPQAAVEEVLEDHLRRVGVEIERGVELTALAPDLSTSAVSCTLAGAAGRTERFGASYVVGCDGVDSTVRRQVGIGFPSRIYRPRLLLADLEVDGDLEPGTINGYVGPAGVLFLFPSPGDASWRLLTVRPAFSARQPIRPSGFGHPASSRGSPSVSTAGTHRRLARLDLASSRAMEASRARRTRPSMA